MNRAGQNVSLLTAGAALLWITIADHEYLNYVRPGFRLLVIGTGAVLCALGGTGLLADWRRHPEEPSRDAHHHGGGPRVAWLFLLPPLAVFAVAPSALGAFTASRALNPAATSAGTGRSLGALPSGGGPARISLTEFTARAFQARSGHDTLTGRQVVLTGFAVPAGPDRWLLVRLRMTCCAADAVPMRIAIGDAPAPAADSWIQVTGTWSPAWAKIHNIDTPRLTATAVRRLGAPSAPYESRAVSVGLWRRRGRVAKEHGDQFILEPVDRAGPTAREQAVDQGFDGGHDQAGGHRDIRDGHLRGSAASSSLAAVTACCSAV